MKLKERNPDSETRISKPDRIGRRMYQAAVMVTMMAMCSIQAFAAGETVWTKAQQIMNDVYGQIVTISTIAAVMTASVALLLMNFSKNGRTVDESRAWLKRICITWAIINGLGFIMAYPIHKGCDPIFCQKCLSTELVDPVDQSAVSCEYCGKDLSEAPEGTIICKGCADLRQLCQRCGQPLRLADFKGIFVGTGGARLHRGDEKQIIALLLGRQK